MPTPTLNNVQNVELYLGDDHIIYRNQVLLIALLYLR